MSMLVTQSKVHLSRGAGTGVLNYFAGTEICSFQAKHLCAANKYCTSAKKFKSFEEKLNIRVNKACNKLTNN